ncbi:MAG: hypothetical protein ACRDRH_14885 [Pseudonocardia sp.]
MPTLDLVLTLDEYGCRLARPLPDTFSLADTNPLNGRPYQCSAYGDLPPYAMAAVGVTGGAWDGLVRAGVVALVLDVNRLYSLAGTLGELRTRQRLVWDGELDLGESVGAELCSQCLGTLIAHDFDGSVTGTPDAPFVCACREPNEVTRHSTIAGERVAT